MRFTAERKIFKNNRKGFSLIEVAIAIVVVGLVVSMTLKGRELIHTAKLNSVIEQVNTFRMTAQLFIDKYNALPGDLANAKYMIGSSLENGRGDGRFVNVDDGKRFWEHLVASGLLSIELAHGFPVSRIGGYYFISDQVDGLDGIWIVLSSGTANNSTFSGIISQEDAYMIDKKCDNGVPNSGDVRTFKAGSGGMVPIRQQYDLKDKTSDCVIMFKLQ